MSGSLFRNTVLYLPAQILGPIVQFSVMVAWTHLLAPSAFGVVSFIVAAQEFAGFLGLQWWALYLVRFRRRFEDGQSEAFERFDQRMALAGGLVQALLAPLIAWASGAELTVELLVAVVAYLVSRLWLTHYSEWARSRHHIGLYSLAQLLGPVLGSLLSIAAILAFGPDPAAALIAMALGQSVGALIVMAAHGRWPGWGADFPNLFAAALRFGVPLIFSAAFFWVSVNGVRVVVQFSAGIEAAGLLAAGWTLGFRIANVVAMLFTVAAFPLAVDRMELGDVDGANRQIAVNGVVMLGLLAPTFVGAAALARPLVELLISEPYRAATTAIFPVAVLTGALRMMKTHVADQSMVLHDSTGAQMAVNALDAACCLIGCLVGVRWGPLGAALGCLAGTCVGVVAMFGVAAMRFGLPLLGRSMALALACAAAMGGALLCLPDIHSIWGLAAAVVFGIIVYALTSALAFPQARRMVLARAAQRLRPAA